MVIMRIVSKLTFLGMVFLFSVNAYAGQLDSSGLLDTLLDKFQQVASTWSLGKVRISGEILLG